MTGLGRFLSLFLLRKMNGFYILRPNFLLYTSCFFCVLDFLLDSRGFLLMEDPRGSFFIFTFPVSRLLVTSHHYFVSHVNRRYQLLSLLFISNEQGIIMYLLPLCTVSLLPLPPYCRRTIKSDHVGSCHLIVHFALLFSPPSLRPHCFFSLLSPCTLLRTANL